MNKISNDIFKEVFDEISSDSEFESSVIDKVAFDINMTPGTMIGSLTGALIANKRMKEDILKKQFNDDATRNLEGNYYTQVQNIVENLKVIFTPFGTVYVVKSKGREITIETIQTEEMNRDMYAAWQHKDYNYFKNLLINKMHSDIQLVEQNFAKKLLERQMGVKNGIMSRFGKQASEEDTDFEDLTMPEFISQVSEARDFYSKQTPQTEKIAGFLIDSSDSIEFRISWGLERPFDKYAGVADHLGFLGLKDNTSDIKSLQKGFLDHGYLSDKVKVGFMPDRVLFMVDNKVVSTLPVIQMNEDAFIHFEKQDKMFFVNMFNKESKKGIMRMQGKIPPNSKLADFSISEKRASYNGIASIFERQDIHPIIYFIVLTRQYGGEWMTFEPYALIKIIEDDFGLSEGIDDIALNKVLSIQVANNSKAIYEQSHAFEKVIRAFNDKPVDFLVREIDDIDIEDIAFAINVLFDVTPHKDIYDNFSDNVLSHIVEILCRNEYRVFSPEQMIEAPLKNKFVGLINLSLLNAFDSVDTKGIDDHAHEASIIKENAIIAHATMHILEELRMFKAKYSAVDEDKFVDVKISKMQIPLSDNDKNIIKIQVVSNAEMDDVLRDKKLLLERQKAELGL